MITDMATANWIIWLREVPPIERWMWIAAISLLMLGYGRYLRWKWKVND